MHILFIPSWPVLGAFAAASLVLAATPGPGVLFIVSRTLAQGRRAGLASVAGVALGNLGNALGAALGLSLWLAGAPAAAAVLRLAGGAYLVYLGWTTWRVPGSGGADARPPALLAPRQCLKEGFWVALLNPKTAVFFAAFLPPFLNAAGSTLEQSVLLGAVFVLIAAVSDSAYVLVAAALAHRAASFGPLARAGRALAAALLVGLGLWTAVSG